ncbi:MAG: hypothetical protein ACPLRW_07900 [Moorellales bacterium]
MPEEITGVETAPVAGGQQAVEGQEEGLDLSFLEDETGVEKEEPAAAGQEGEEGQDQRVEQAFAKRLAQEREKIRRELEEEFRQRYQQPTYQPAVQPLPPPPSLEERAQKLAEEWMITPEAAKAFILQEERLRELNSRLYLLQDNVTKARAEAAINEQRKQNPHLPPFNEQQLISIRLRYYDQYGVVPTWEDAYKMYVAEAVARGELGRNVEQQVISQITGRNRANVQIGRAEQPQKRSIADLSDEEFEKLKEKAKRGELRKT